MPLVLGGDDTGLGDHHPKITLISGGNGEVILINTASGSNRTRMDFQDGRLDSIAFAPDGDPITVKGDTIIFDGGESDIDFSIKVSPGQNGNTRFDVTTVCPTP